MVTFSYTALLLVCIVVGLSSMGVGALLVCVLEEIHIGHICDRDEPPLNSRP